MYLDNKVGVKTERKLFEERKSIFKETIKSIGNLPKTWQYSFEDGEDERIWFDKLLKTNEYLDYINEIKELLDRYDKKILTDKEKENEFYEYVIVNNRIPLERESYFSDNSDMRMWYMSYKDRHQDFETRIHNSLSEYNSFNIVEIWPDVKHEFIHIIKELKRIPRHNEVNLQCGIDVRSIYDKLETFDPIFFERVNLHLSQYGKITLDINDRVRELLDKISSLGYIPDLRECRFSDSCDMFTWYLRYKDKLPELENEINKRITKEKALTKVNIYLIPNFKNKGGKFYTICTNVGEELDLTGINTYEEAKKLDSNLTKRGGLLLKKDEEIGIISKGGRK